ncbi:MAG: hypothetical protein HQL30_09790 [Candidatus Omnitrophica bacterium]|nr:hypothetical protein [Candidatus Omnitrophota bacterium]
MKFDPIGYLGTYGCDKKDLKNIVFLIVTLLAVCLIINKFLVINVRIIQGSGERITVAGSVHTETSVSDTVKVRF